MKKCLYLFIIIYLTSCGKQNDTADNINEISFWHFWSEPSQKKALQFIISDFEKLNNCKVKLTELSWNDGKTKLFAAFNSNTGPDVLELGSDWVAQFSSSKVLNEIEKGKSGIDNFIAFSTEPSYWNNKIYALPWVVDTRLIFYNKSLMDSIGVDSPPNSFAELLEYSKSINDLDGVYGFGTNGADKNRLYKKIITFLWSNGGGVIKNNKSILNSIENKEAFEYIKLLSSYSIIENQKNLDDLFANGKIGFTISGSWLINKINEFNDDNSKSNIKTFEYGVIEIPLFNGKKGVSFAGGEYLSINNKSNNKDLALKLVKYLTNGANSIKFCKKIPEAGFPADKNYFNNNYFQTLEYKSIFAKQLYNAKMTPITPNWLNIQDELERLAENIIYEKIKIEIGIKNTSLKIDEILLKQ